MKTYKFTDWEAFLEKQWELWKIPHIHFTAEFDPKNNKLEIVVINGGVD